MTGATVAAQTPQQRRNVPLEIGQLSDLEWLNVSNNQLTQLPEAIGQLSNLEWLNLSGNQLTRLPDAIVQLSNLERLILDNNPLVSPPPEMVENGTLAVLGYLQDEQQRHPDQETTWRSLGFAGEHPARDRDGGDDHHQGHAERDSPGQLMRAHDRQPGPYQYAQVRQDQGRRHDNNDHQEQEITTHRQIPDLPIG